MKNIIMLLLIASQFVNAGDTEGSGASPQSIVTQENEAYYIVCTISSESLPVDCIVVAKENTGTGS